MASHDSALKAHRQNVKRREHNRQLRTRLRSALRDIRAAIDSEDPAKVKEFAAAQARLSTALVPFRQQLQENYPDLKSNTNFLALQSQLEGTENRITIARRDYNGAVQQYNTLIRTFPNSIGAKVFYGAKPMQTFEATAPNAQRAPTVSF